MTKTAQHTLTRSECYDLVWSIPLAALALDYQITVYRWRQLCVRYSIPLPRPKHWTKIRVGISVERPALSPWPPDSPEPTIFFSKRVHGEPSGTIPMEHELQHPLLFSVQKSLTCTKNSFLRHGLRQSTPQQVDIRAAPDNVSRALQFMDALLMSVQNRGYTIEVKSQGSFVRVHGQAIGFRCRERLRRIPIAEMPYLRYLLEPTGVLSFQLIIRHVWHHREWAEGAQSLEEQIPAILEKMESESGKLDKEQRERESGWADLAERQRVLQEGIQHQQNELDRFKDLLRQSARYQKTKDLRAYLATFKQGSDADQTSDRDEWLLWAHAKADWYDPELNIFDPWLPEVKKDTLNIEKPQEMSEAREDFPFVTNSYPNRRGKW